MARPPKDETATTPAIDLSRLGHIGGTSCSGSVYRFIGSRFLSSPLSSAGSRQHGGRFNPPESFEVLYTALAADTAIAEREGILLTHAAIKLAHGIRTGVLLKIECQLHSVLNLAEESTRIQLGVSLQTLVGPWITWGIGDPSQAVPALAPSQRIGSAVHADGRFEGILTLSAKDPGGRCLAIFPERLRKSSQVRVADSDDTIRASLGL